jgi:hypothetical protein
MIMIGLGSWLVGAVLGLRFRLLALVPFVLIGIVTITTAPLLCVTTLQTTISAEIIFIVAIQFGYVGGLLTRAAITASRAPAAHRRSLTARI